MHVNALSRHTLGESALPMFGHQARGIDVTTGNPFRAGLGCTSCGEVPVTSARLAGLGYADQASAIGQPSQGVVDFRGVVDGLNSIFSTITGQAAAEHGQENAVALAAYQSQAAQAIAASQAAQAQSSAMAQMASYWPLALGGAAVLGVAVLLLRK